MGVWGACAARKHGGAAGGWLVERGRTSQGAIVAWLSCCVVMALAARAPHGFERRRTLAAPLPGYRRAPGRCQKPFGATSTEA